VIGGGSRNGLLCRLTADIIGRAVMVGPVEATALGNVLVQARAARELPTGPSRLRAVARASARAERIDPRDSDAGDEIYRRFLALTTMEITQ
jgi:rhamnulokinase